MQETIDTFNTLKDFLDSPLSTVGSWLGDKVVNSIGVVIDGSYWVLLAVSMCGLFLYVGGVKKASKYTTSPALVYLLLQLLKLSL